MMKNNAIWNIQVKERQGKQNDTKGIHIGDKKANQFREQRHKKDGDRRNKYHERRQEMRWNRVGVEIGNQLEAFLNIEKIG